MDFCLVPEKIKKTKQLKKNMDSLLLLQPVLVVSFSVVFFWKLIKYMWSFLNVEKEPVRILVTGAAGMLIFFFSRPFMFLYFSLELNFCFCYMAVNSSPSLAHTTRHTMGGILMNGMTKILIS